MKNSKLIALLNTLQTAEWKRFGDFLESPFFNKREDLIRYYQYLEAMAPNFEAANLEKEVVFKKIYPNQQFEERAVVHLNNYMLKQAERFLAEICLEEKDHALNIYILESLQKRDLVKNYRHYIKKAKNQLIQSNNNVHDFYQIRYQLSAFEKMHFLKQNERHYNPIIQQAMNDFDSFYFINKLKYSCELIDWTNIIASDFKPAFIKEVLHHLKESKTQDPILLQYMAVYSLLTEAEEEESNYFSSFRKLMKQYSSVTPDSEKRYLYSSAINHCGLQIRRGNDVYYYGEQCLELYLEGIYDQFLLTNGYIAPGNFKNIVKLGFNLKKLDWTEQFIHEYHPKLEPKFQEDALHFNLADYHYRKKEYQKAQIHLLQVQFSDIFYNLGARTMLIKIYHETNEIEALLSNLASFSIYLKRNKKITNNIRQTYLNFTSLLYKLIRVKPNKITALKEKINQTTLLTDRRWLLLHVNTLK